MISGLTFTGADHRSSGGAILNHWDLSLVDSVIVGNAALTGGGLFHRTGSLTLLNSEIRDNTGTSGGGGIALSSHFGAVIRFTTIADNASEIGGGIFNNAAQLLLVADSTISRNRATLFAGGIHNSSVSTLTLSSSTLSGNSTGDEGELSNSGVATVLSSTIASVATNPNSLALDNTGSRLAIHNSIVAGDVSHFGTGELVGSNNLFGDAVGAFPIVGANNRFGLDPVLGPLEDNGGPTKTHALLDGSPAIDAGDAAFHPGMFGLPILDDQRGVGFARVAEGDGRNGPRLDIGAFEAQDPLASLPSDFNNDGAADEADLAVWRASFDQTTGADADNDGDSDGNDVLLWQRSVAKPPVVGNFDRDEDVDGQDLVIWKSSFRTSASADANGDGATDGHDFLLWQRNLNVSPLATGLAFVAAPEDIQLLDWPYLSPLTLPAPVSQASTAASSRREDDERPAQHAAFASLEAAPIVAPVLYDNSDSNTPKSIEASSNTEGEETCAAMESLFDAVFEQNWY
jgi:hypothetical protein